MAALTAPVAEQLEHPALRQQQVNRVPYLPGLDGLRALAVIAVMVYHADHAWLSGGFLGVEVFFVISGYLITLLLISEKDRTGRVSLRHFWLRRAKRLLPALYFVLLPALAIYLALFRARPMGSLRGDFVWGFGYGSNWYQLYVGQGYAAQGVFTPLRHLWSLAVEEQFYLLWPLVMVVLLRKGSERLPRVAMRLFMVAVAIAVLVAVLYVPGTIGSEPSLDTRGYWKAPLGWLPFMEDRWISVNETLYLSTFTRAGGLMLGAAFAMVWRPLAVMRGPLRKRGRRIDLLALLALVGLVLMVRGLALAEESSEALFASEYDPWLFRGGFFLTGLCSVLLIAAATHRRSRIGRLLGMRPLRWVGTRSYGLYLYHWPVYEVLRGDDAHLDGTRFVLAMLVTVPVAELSYRVVELPVRHGRLGQWLRGQRPARTVRMKARRRNAVVFGGAMAVLAGFAAVSVARAQILCVTDIECDAEAAAAGASAPSTTSPPPTTLHRTETTVADDFDIPTMPRNTTSTTIDPLASMPTYAIGESVMLGAAPQLQAGGIIVDAAVSRQGPAIAEIIEAMRANGQIGRSIIIQTGTNGTVSDETFARIMAQLPADLTPHVYFITVKAPRGWIEENNLRIRHLPNLYPNVTVVRWDEEALKILGELSNNDGGIHLRSTVAKQFYANMIFTAMGRPDLVK